MTDKAPFALGWEEWASLPDLGLPALKVKVDTGARTSALHAFDIEPFGHDDAPKVRFNVHPVPGREDITISCSADVVDRREVTSSNGETELRYVIASDIKMGDHIWPIEITLTNRNTMAYRMLLGRQAISENMVITPSESFCQPRLDSSVYFSSAIRASGPARACASRSCRVNPTAIPHGASSKRAKGAATWSR